MKLRKKAKEVVRSSIPGGVCRDPIFVGSYVTLLDETGHGKVTQIYHRPTLVEVDTYRRGSCNSRIEVFQWFQLKALSHPAWHMQFLEDQYDDLRRRTEKIRCRGCGALRGSVGEVHQDWCCRDKPDEGEVSGSHQQTWQEAADNLADWIKSLRERLDALESKAARR